MIRAGHFGKPEGASRDFDIDGGLDRYQLRGEPTKERSMSELVQITRRTTRRFNARGHMMVALFEGVHRVVTMLARALRALASRLTFRRNRALAP